MLSDKKVFFKRLLNYSWLPVFVLCVYVNITFAQSSKDFFVDLNGQTSSILSVQNTSSQKLKKIIQLESGKKTLGEALEYIAKKAGFNLSYSEELIPVDRKVNLKQANLTVEQALWRVLDGTSLRFGVSPNGQLFFFLNQNTKIVKQLENITGIVTDAISGESLPGVNVVVKGTTSGTSTDSEGRFELDVPSLQDTLIFSFIGYETQTIPINNRLTIDVRLSPQSIIGAELVVVGYGQQQKSDITGAISSVSGEDLREVPVSDVSHALQGLAAGVRVQQTSTRPGESAQIRIRGARSLTASNDPLIVVDGIPYNGSLSDLNTNLIKSVEVLKDASATAIYGSRGANGIVLITTEKGAAGEVNVSYNAYQGINNVSRRYDMMSGPELLAMQEAANIDNYSQVQQQAIEEGNFNDWQDLMYQRGNTSDHQLSISGGSEKSQYSLGTGYHKESTILPGISFERFSANLSIDQDIGDHLRVGLSTINSFNVKKGNEVENVMYQILTNKPFDVAYDESGEIVQTPSGISFLDYNPLYMYDEELWEQQQKRSYSFNTLYGEVDIIEGLRFRINAGVSYLHQESSEYFGQQSHFVSGGQSSAAVNNASGYDYTIENLLFYDKNFNENHEINLTALFSVQESQIHNTDVAATNMVAGYAKYYNLGLSVNPIDVSTDNQEYANRAILSYMGRLNYSYQDRYLLTLSGRFDGSSVLAEGNKWHYYPAAAVGWNVINESFMNGQNLMTDLKVRLSYGETSNQAISPYETLGALSQSVYNFGSNNVYGYYLSSLPNTNLGWENTKSLNAGVDFGFLNGRLTGSIEFYRQKTVNVLVAQELPPTNGVSGFFLNNVGETENKGIGLNLSSRNFLSDPEGFNWSTDLNFSLNRNEILSLTSGVQRDVGNGWFVGHPINVIYDYEKLGIWQSDEAAEAAQYGQEPGTIKVADLNEDGIINGDDRKILGDLNPNFEIGMINRFSYKGFDLSITAFASIGGMLISALHQPQSYLNNLGGNGFSNNLDVDYWTPENPTNKYPKPRTDRGDNPVYGSTLGYYDASFLKIRSINLGYSLPEKWINTIGGQSIRLYANVKNVATLFSPYIRAGGVDPEPNGFGGNGLLDTPVPGENIPARQLTIGAELPPVRSVNFGINIDF